MNAPSMGVGMGILFGVGRYKIASIVFNKYNKNAAFGRLFYWRRVGIRRGRPLRSRGKKHAGGMFFRPGENPYPHERIRYGCGHEDIIRCRKVRKQNPSCQWQLGRRRLDDGETSIFCAAENANESLTLRKP